jgi:cell division protein FtsB
MHELAEQWKQFGTTTIHKLECQIVDYQEKLIELEQRQMLLLNENQSLKSHIDEMIIKTTPDVIQFSFIGINFFFFFLEKISTKYFNSSQF